MVGVTFPGMLPIQVLVAANKPWCRLVEQDYFIALQHGNWR